MVTEKITAEQLGLKNLTPAVLKARDRLMYQKIKQEHLKKYPELKKFLKKKPGKAERPSTAHPVKRNKKKKRIERLK